MSDSKQSVEVTDKDVVEHVLRKPFGAVLKKARKQAKISYDQISQNLLLSTDIIKAIDNSRIDELPAAAFTKGYIRSYARLLDVPADEVVEAYLNLVESPDAELVSLSVAFTKKTGRDTIIKFLGFNVLITVFIVVFFWLFKTTDDITPQAEILNTENELAAQKFEGKPLKKSIEPLDTQDQSLVENNDTGHVEIIDHVIADQPKKKIDMLPQVIPADKTDLSIKEASANRNSQAVTNDEKGQVVVSDDKISHQLLESPDQLALSVIDESWCEIKDATGKRVCYQLLKKGDKKLMSGVAPFNVFLGNARGVQLEFNGKIVEFEGFIRQYSKVVRVEIDKNGDLKASPKR